MNALSPSILLVEDNPDDILLLREMTEAREGVSLEVVDQLSGAIERLQQASFDLVLLDLDLPDSQGLKTLEKLQAKRFDVPIVILTGPEDEAIGAQAVHRGAQDHLVKGEVTGSLLGRVVRHAVERHQMQEELRQHRDCLEELVREHTGRLQESEKRFRAVAQTALDAIIIANQRGEIVFCNPAAEVLFGYPAQEMVATSITDLMPERFREAHREALRTFLQTERPSIIGTTVELAGLRRGGNEFPLQLSLSTWEVDGKTYFSALIRDISERKQAEQALRQYAKRLQILWTIDQGILATQSPKTIAQTALGKLKEVIPFNQATIVTFDMETDEGEVLAAYPPGQMPAGESERLPLAIHSQAMTKLQHHELNVVEDAQQFNAPDTAVWSLGVEGVQTYFNVPLMAEGNLIGALTVGGDSPGLFTSEHRGIAYEVASQLAIAIQQAQTREALKSSEKRFRSFFHQAAVPMAMVDEAGYIVEANEADRLFLGYRPGELVGLHFTQFTHPHDLDLDERQYSELVAGQRDHYTIEKRYLRKDGRVVWGRVFVSRVNQNGPEAPYSVVVCEDITQHKHAQQRLESYADRLAGLHQIDQAILAAEQPQTIAQSALQHLQRLVSCDRANVTLFDFEQSSFEILAILGSNEARARERYPMEAFPYQREQIRQAELLMVDDIDKIANPSRIDQMLRAGGIRSYINLPLTVKGEVIGTLNLGDRSPAAFSEEQIEVARQVADSLAIVIQHARTLEAERDQREMAEALRETAEAISSSLELSDVLDRMLENLSRVVPYDTADVLLLDPSNTTARFARSQGYERFGGEGPARWSASFSVNDKPGLRQMLRTHAPVIIPDTHDAKGWVQFQGTEWIRSSVGAPIISEGKMLGFLFINSAKLAFFTPDHGARLSAFALQVAVAIQNARLYEELEHYSEYLEQAVEERTAELQWEKERVEAILRSTGDAILIIGLEGRIQAANPAFEALSGQCSNDLIGLPARKLAELINRETLMEDMTRAAQAGEPWWGELTVQEENGEEMALHLQVSPLQQVEEFQGFVVTIRDITPLKELDRMKDAFLSTAAHELRTPLTSIRGFSEILLKRDLDTARTKRYLTLINEQSANLAYIIDDLLDVSKLEAGRGLDIRPEPIHFGALVDGIVPLFEEMSPDHRFRVKGFEEAPLVSGDSMRLTQVVRNLLANAVKYSPQGGTVTIRGCQSGEVLEIRVEDEGIGMTPDQQKHLFEKFYRADSSSTTGTGLGLTICKLIIEKHGGEIFIESEAGEGTTVSFTVPLAIEITSSEPKQH